MRWNFPESVVPPSFAKFRPCHAPRMTDRLLPDRPFPPLHHILFRFPCLQSAIVSLHSFRSKLVEWKSSSIYVMESKEETRDGVSFVERREEFTSIIFSNRKNNNKIRRWEETGEWRSRFLIRFETDFVRDHLRYRVPWKFLVFHRGGLFLVERERWPAIGVWYPSTRQVGSSTHL